MSKRLLILGVLHSSWGWADAGCHSFNTPACFLWFSILLLGISLFFWGIFSPIFIVLNLILKLNKKYKIYCAIFSFMSVLLTLGLSFTGVYDFIWNYGDLEKYKNYMPWIVTPSLFILIYLVLYLFQTRFDRSS